MKLAEATPTNIEVGVKLSLRELYVLRAVVGKSQPHHVSVDFPDVKESEVYKLYGELSQLVQDVGKIYTLPPLS